MNGKADEEDLPMKQKSSMTRSKSFTSMQCLSAEDQDVHLNALRISRFYNKVFCENEPLPAPTRFLKSSPRSSLLGNESEKVTAPEFNQQLRIRRSVSEPEIHAATFDKANFSGVMATNEARKVSTSTCRSSDTLAGNENAK